MYDIKIPTVGESITEVTIAQWLKNDGDFVNEGDLICEIESDKASFELPAEATGILRVNAAEGDVLAIGASVGSIEEGGSKPAPKKEEKIAAPAVAKSADPPPQSKAKTTQSVGAPLAITVPTVGESITEVTIAQWLKKDGEAVAEGDLICEIESDKASFELPAEVAGVLKQQAAEGDVVEIGDTIAEITPGGSVSTSAPLATQPVVNAPASNGTAADAGHAKVTPVAANILAEAGIDPDKVAGSGPGGKILKEDAIKARDSKSSAPAAPPAAQSSSPTPPVAPAAEIVGERSEKRERMSSLRKTIARRLVEVKNQTAMLTTFNEIDMTGIMETRAKYKEMFKEKYGIKLGFMSLFTRAVCIAASEWPSVNGRIEDNHIIYHNYCDVSIAVSSPRGLVVPVVRNADKLSLADIEKTIMDLAIKARDGKLSIEEMTGGTFTITNGGIFGSLMSTPIINAPQSAILGMHKIEQRPVVVNGEIVARPMMYLALSYDHRIVDGKESVSFLVRVKELLEDPARMLLEV
ncbi:MAG: 2-oxoglutarate dehydrogenase complex dihydrolipoyllysine-residue succinyltransferase [Calditrichia bacterium]